jgi:hypothetical protein
MFGIGFAISIPLVVVALELDAIGDYFREMRRRLQKLTTKSKGQSNTETEKTALAEKVDGMSYVVDTLALEQALSAGRTTAGRRSYESHYLGGTSLLPVTSRGTGRTSHANGHGKNETDVHMPPERANTGFRMRASADIERGV